MKPTEVCSWLEHPDTGRQFLRHYDRLCPIRTREREMLKAIRITVIQDCILSMPQSSQQAIADAAWNRLSDLANVCALNDSRWLIVVTVEHVRYAKQQLEQ